MIDSDIQAILDVAIRVHEGCMTEKGLQHNDLVVTELNVLYAVFDLYSKGQTGRLERLAAFAQQLNREIGDDNYEPNFFNLN